MNPILLHVIVGAVSALVGFVLAVVFSPWYNRKAEQLENLTADKADNLAKYFSGIAQELRAPGK